MRTLSIALCVMGLSLAGCSEPPPVAQEQSSEEPDSPVAETSTAEVEQQWLTTYDSAVAEAKQSKKLILADFTGSDWCGYCILLKEEVFDTPAFQRWANENVVLLELDFPQQKEQDEQIKKQNEALAKKHGIEGFPTILFLDSSGKVRGTMGYQPGGPTPWIEQAQRILDGSTTL